MLICIQTSLDISSIRITARLRCVWKRLPTGPPPLRGNPLTSIPGLSEDQFCLCVVQSWADVDACPQAWLPKLV